MFKKVLTERVVVIERGVNKVLKYTESCELFLIGNVAASDPSVFDSGRATLSEDSQEIGCKSRIVKNQKPFLARNDGHH